MKVKFSVIIPVYNCERYIENCVQSILDTKYENLEIIIVDDGSIDNTGNILRKIALKSKKIKVFFQENSGVSSARNFGVLHATGQYVHFVDADDTVDKKIYADMNKIIKENSPDIIRFDYFLNKNGIMKNNSDNLNHFEINQVNKLKSYFIKCILDEKIKAYVWQVIIKKNLIVDFNEKLCILEDENFILEILSNSNNIYISQEKYYFYNISNEFSATKSKEKILKMMENMLVANKVIKFTMKKNGIAAQDNLKIFDSRMAHSFANYLELLYINTGNFELACSQFESIVKKKDLKKVFVFMDYRKLSLKHKVTTFLTINKKYKLLRIIYKLKDGKI